jgi:hypothetical protein
MLRNRMDFIGAGNFWSDFLNDKDIRYIEKTIDYWMDDLKGFGDDAEMYDWIGEQLHYDEWCEREDQRDREEEELRAMEREEELQREYERNGTPPPIEDPDCEGMEFSEWANASDDSRSNYSNDSDHGDDRCFERKSAFVPISKETIVAPVVEHTEKKKTRAKVAKVATYVKKADIKKESKLIPEHDTKIPMKHMAVFKCWNNECLGQCFAFRGALVSCHHVYPTKVGFNGKQYDIETPKYSNAENDIFVASIPKEMLKDMGQMKQLKNASLPAGNKSISCVIPYWSDPDEKYQLEGCSVTIV